MKTVIEMAREAGLIKDGTARQGEWHFQMQLERFAAIVREEVLNRLENKPMYFIPSNPIEAAVLAEREACAKVCDARYMGDNNREDWEALRCAAAIRARGE